MIEQNPEDRMPLRGGVRGMFNLHAGLREWSDNAVEARGSRGGVGSGISASRGASPAMVFASSYNRGFPR